MKLVTKLFNKNLMKKVFLFVIYYALVVVIKDRISKPYFKYFNLQL